ncbi:MAG TPA: PDZ domain-containing protein [Steroidobacteraceae bacterium]|nr:PDZ domain-containing protein [Steroidobacteraceae bacterium]
MKSLSASIPAILATVLAAPSVLGQTPAPGGDAVTAPAPPAPVASASDEGGAGDATGGAQKAAPDSEERLKAAQRRLEAAQAQLESAAREVAELSAERGGAFVRQYSRIYGGVAPFEDGRGRAIIGVQVENASGGAGARVVDVSPGGPAAEAGIRPDDVITSVNGSEVKGDDAARQVARMLRDLKPESKVRVEVSRNGKAQQFTLTARRGPGFMFFGPGPGAPAMPAAPAPPAPPALAFGPGSMSFFLTRGALADMELATLSPRLGNYFGTDKGVLVVRAPAEGALKLQDGDVILSIDGREPTSGQHATRILTSYQPGEKIELRVIRERKHLDIATTMPGEAQRRNRVYFRSGQFSAPEAPGRVIIMRNREAI